MPAQKRSLPESKPEDEELEEEDDDDEEQKDENAEDEQEPKLSPKQLQQQLRLQDSEDDEGGSHSDRDEFIFVKLADIRKEVQCPICLGIIRKTRTVMECLHRFCRECIDKSMRLGNNECPACRTHCASRRSLRDDPNYDALIAALYPDIDKHEEEESAFLDEEKNQNNKIQASIAETFRRQSEALGKRKPTAKATAAAFLRKSRSSHGLRGRGRTNARDTLLAVSEDEEDEDSNRNDGKESSSADEPSPDRRQKRPRRWTQPRSSPATTTANADNTGDENDEVEITRDNQGSSPLQVGNREMLVWGRGGVRSQIRHPGSNGRFVKGGRITKLVEHIRNLKKDEKEFEVHLELLPMGEQSVAIQRPYICCKPTLTIRNLCQFIALQTSVKDEEVEILVRKPQFGSSELKPSNPSEELQVVAPQESLAGLCDSSPNTRGNLVLMYHLKTVN